MRGIASSCSTRRRVVSCGLRAPARATISRWRSMTHGIAARVATLDIDGDGFADRLYTADVGGRVWRFDVWNGRARGQLVTGGVFASLGVAEPAGTLSDARRFFTAPDVALMQSRGQNAWYNLAIGSGDGDNVYATGVTNRFYSLRDRDPFSEANAGGGTTPRHRFSTPILRPVGTPAASGARRLTGWKLDLGPGEQVSGRARHREWRRDVHDVHEPGGSVEGSLCASRRHQPRLRASRGIGGGSARSQQRHASDRSRSFRRARTEGSRARPCESRCRARSKAHQQRRCLERQRRERRPTRRLEQPA